MRCTLPGGIDDKGNEYAEMDVYYCPKHAEEEGFCYGCGVFVAGWKDNGLCDNCEYEMRSYEDDDDDEGYFDNEDFI